MRLNIKQMAPGETTLKQLVGAADVLGLELHIQLVADPRRKAAESTLRAIHVLRTTVPM